MGATWATMRGRRTFLAGATTLLLFGAVHLLAVYTALTTSPEKPDDVALDHALRESRERMGPFEFSSWGLVQVLNSSYSVLLLHVAALNLLVARAAAAHGALRRLTLLDAVGSAVLVAICLIAQFPPPALFALVACIFFAVSWWRQRPVPLS